MRQYPTSHPVVRLQTRPKVTTANTVRSTVSAYAGSKDARRNSPAIVAAIHTLVRSALSGSVRGLAVLGNSAASATLANSSLMDVHDAHTCSGALMPSSRVYSSGCISKRCVVLS